MVINKRIYKGFYPKYIVYADRENRDGRMYKRLAFIWYDKSVLDIQENCPEKLKTVIIQDAKQHINNL